MKQNQQTINTLSCLAMTTDPTTLAAWTEPVQVQTKFGPRLLRKAEPTDQFSAAWCTDKDALKALGIGWSKDPRTGAWGLTWWQKLPGEVVAAAEERKEASRLAVSDFDPPHPEGLSYLPFQRAGIEFALKVFGQTSNEKGECPSVSRGVYIADEMGL